MSNSDEAQRGRNEDRRYANFRTTNRRAEEVQAMEALRVIAEAAKDKGLRPIDCPELMAAMGKRYNAFLILIEVWGIKADKYHKSEQSAEYARRYPFYPGKEKKKKL